MAVAYRGETRGQRPADKEVETATRPGSSEPAFHANDFEEAVEYSSLSALAIVGLLFGLASPLCMVSRFFLFVPLLGAVFSVLALVRISASAGTLAGRAAACIGLALCVAFGVAELTRGIVTRQLRTAEAQEFATKWLDILTDGKVDEAFKLTVAGSRPAPFPEPGQPAPTSTPLDEFKKLELIQDIAAAGSDAKIDFESTEQYERRSWRQFNVQQLFRISPSATSDAKPKPFDVLLTVERSKFTTDYAWHWLISDYKSPTDAVQ
jgi:hypothetical protein